MTAVLRRAQITEDVLSVDTALNDVHDSAVGGVAVFVGVVRDHDGGHAVSRLDYSAHPDAERQLADAARRIGEAHDVVAVSAAHRVGPLSVGDRAVVLAVGAAHRTEAFAGCRALIEDIKRSVPIWKHQFDEVGNAEWVEL